MSYILDALKISEQARDQAAGPLRPSLLPPAGEADAQAGRPWPVYLLIAVLLFNAVAIVVLLWPPSRDARVATAASPTAAAAEAEVASAAAAIAGPPPPTAGLRPPAIDSLPQTPASASGPATTTTAPRTPVTSPAAKDAAAAERPAPRAAPAESVALAPTQPPAPKPAATVEIAADGLPPGAARQLPSLAVAGFIQDADQNNLVIVNDRLLREGDEAAPGVKLERILADGVIFSFKGYRFKR